MKKSIHALYVAAILGGGVLANHHISTLETSHMAQVEAMTTTHTKAMTDAETAHTTFVTALHEKHKVDLEWAEKKTKQDFEEKEYLNDIVKCREIAHQWVGGVKKCLGFTLNGADHAKYAALTRDGFKGPLFFEQFFKTKEGAIHYMGTHNWKLKDAKKDGDVIIWDNDYPRVFKITSTKKGWAVIGTFTDIEPEETK